MLSKETYLSRQEAVAERTYQLILTSLAEQAYLTEPGLREVTGCYLEHRGKALRPALVVFSCLCCGGTEENALPAAAAVEMFHTWTLMDDDIIDHDDFRRGRPSAHRRGAGVAERELGLVAEMAAEYGRDLALVGANALEGFAGEMLAQAGCSPQVALALVKRMFGKLNPELLSGEMLDVKLSFLPWENVHPQDIMEMMRLKTSALLAFSAEAGAAIGRDTSPDNCPDAQTLSQFATACGLAFQLADDLLGVFGDASFGKPIGSDIREGKRTLLALTALERATPSARARFLELLGKQDATPDDIQDARQILEESGARSHVETTADRFVNDALQSLQTLPANEGRDLLEHWATSMTHRKI
ncbi:MAG: polyprenyl synthetase family protein [Victivallales bacterium]|nr:polyprenyl synthetase family protein [Victivallales bacterium]